MLPPPPDELLNEEKFPAALPPLQLDVLRVEYAGTVPLSRLLKRPWLPTLNVGMLSTGITHANF